MTESVYNYASVANIESFTGVDYGAIDAVRFSDIKVEAIITITERMINSYLGSDGAVTATDGVIACAIIITAKILHLNLINMGIHGKDEHISELVDLSVQSILRMFLGYDAGVDAIPMSGAND